MNAERARVMDASEGLCKEGVLPQRDSLQGFEHGKHGSAGVPPVCACPVP